MFHQKWCFGPKSEHYSAICHPFSVFDMEHVALVNWKEVW